MKYISKDNFLKLLEFLQRDYYIYIPIKKGNKLFYKRLINNKDSKANISRIDDMVIGGVRISEPLKSFFVKAREKVAEGFKSPLLEENKPYCIVGVKACDLKSLEVYDYVFCNHDYTDPFYIKKREENLIISSDCTNTLDTCFCLAVGVKPYPQKNFDINLSEINSGFIIEVGSQKGQELINKYPFLFEETENELIKQRDERREKVIKKLKKNIEENNVPDYSLFKGIIERNFESDIWKDEAKTCVECGACNTICPTCHCFLLYDQMNNNKMARLRIWDSCMIKDFAEVAGGANPRPRLWMRLRNRFEKKFDFFFKVAHLYACTGCGRCILACPANIDIRKVLRRLVDASKG